MRYEPHFEKISIPKDKSVCNCPFCGSAKITAFRDSLFDNESNIGFYCLGCETLVETRFNDINQAIDHCWNNRDG